MDLQRREVLLRSGAAAGILLLESHGLAVAAQASEQVIPWADQPPARAAPAQAVVKNLTPWESLDSWITPNDKFFGAAASPTTSGR